ncbi:MAG: SusC/RagA family TonB-linked outer membrane protein [Bacteroidota bacterium]
MNKCLTERITWKGLFLSFLLMGIFSGYSSHSENVVTGQYAQEARITVQEELTIKELFKLIEAQTNFDFFYSSNLKELNKRVDLNLTNSSVEKVLSTAFSNTNLEYTIQGKDIMIREASASSQQQEKVVSGTVRDETGVTLPGVNVVVKGSAIGTSSDFDGNYQIEVSEGETLVFSFMGYGDKEVVVGVSNNYNVDLDPSSNVLDEIIVAGVASGTSKKKMSVSVAKVNSEAIKHVPQSSVSSSLQGKVAGVTVASGSGSPGASTTMTLRGATSLTGSQAPMILVDGVIMQGSLADINVDDVESMEVVKGAAASALYGSRAGNGVVVITSKRGSKLNSGETSVTIRNEVGVQQVAKKIDVAQYHPYLLASDWESVDTYTKYKGVVYPDGYVTGWDPGIRKSLRLAPNGIQSQPFRVYNDVQDALFNNGLSYTNYIGVANRVNQTNLFISFENNANQGVLKETGGYGRQSFRLNLDHAINDKLKISASNNYIMTNNDYPGGGTSAFASAVMMDPDVDLFYDNANGEPYNFIPNNWNDKVRNPLYDLYNKSNVAKKTRFMGSYDINWAVFDWMSVKASYSVESEDYNGTAVTPKGTYTAVSEGEYVESQGAITNYYRERLNQNFRATASFNKSFGVIDFNGKLSYLAEDNFYQSGTVGGKNFELSDYPSFSVIGDDDLTFSERTYIDRAENLFAIASFVVKDRYIFDGLVRRDKSSLFGVNNRTNYYYRVSGAYRVSQDIEIPGVQELKFRAAIGTAGQRPGFSYQYETYTRISGQYLKSHQGNKDLKPSNSKEIELGLDIAFLDRVTGEFTYSQTNTSDQFIEVPLLAHKGGYSTQWQNAASLLTNTFEAMVNVNVVKDDNWNWDLGLTFDRTRSQITELEVSEFQTGPQDAFFIREGESFGIMYGNKFVRNLDEMQKQLPEGTTIADFVVNVDGYVVKAGTEGTMAEAPIFLKDESGSNALEIIGDMNPDFNMGLTSTLSYKSFTFYMLWKMKQGGDIYNKTAQNMVRDNRNPIMDQVGKDAADMKSVSYYNGFYNGGQINEYWIEDASYIRFAEASLSYNLNKKQLGSLGKYVSGINLGIIGKNLLTFSKYSGYDPEVLVSGVAYDNYTYPNFRTLSFSLGLQF